MRIAYLSTDPGIAYGGGKGASVHVAELVDALAGEGAEVLVAIAGVTPDARRPAQGVTIQALPGPGKGASAAEHLAADPARSGWIEERVDRFGADALYERLALHSAAGSRAAKRLGIPHLVELNAPLLDESRRYRALAEVDRAEELERATLAGAERVLAVSRPLAGYAARRGAHRVEVFPNAAAIERYPRRPPRSRPHPVAVFAGNVRPWHGIEIVADTWRRLADLAPPLVVAGEPGEARPLLEEAGATLLGAIPHWRVPALLAEADIGLAPYAGDAPDYFSPLKLFEYMAAGLAVVAGDLPAVREVVSEDSAVLVSRGDAEAFAAAVAGLTADALRRERLGRAARALVAVEHTWRHRARRVTEIVVQFSAARAVDREAVGA
jgi:glycosyltransferase involved in cell wall biosynthesis